MFPVCYCRRWAATGAHVALFQAILRYTRSGRPRHLAYVPLFALTILAVTVMPLFQRAPSPSVSGVDIFCRSCYQTKLNTELRCVSFLCRGLRAMASPVKWVCTAVCSAKRSSGEWEHNSILFARSNFTSVLSLRPTRALQAQEGCVSTPSNASSTGVVLWRGQEEKVEHDGNVVWRNSRGICQISLTIMMGMWVLVIVVMNLFGWRKVDGIILYQLVSSSALLAVYPTEWKVGMYVVLAISLGKFVVSVCDFVAFFGRHCGARPTL